MVPESRRTALATLAGILGWSISGCVGLDVTDRFSPKSSTPASGTSDGNGSEMNQVTVEPVDLSDVPADASIVVFHEELREWIEEATRGNEVRVQGRPTRYEVRAFEEFDVDFFPLDGITTARVTATGGDIDGAYEVDATGGTGEPNIYRAEEVDSPPEDAAVIAYDDISEERQEFVRAVIDATPYGGDETVLSADPSTFEWAENELVGSYLQQGEHYYEIEPAHPETQGWPPGHYSLRLRMEPLDETADLTLDLPEMDETTRSSVEEALRAGVVEEPDDALASFADAYDYLTTPVVVWRLSVGE